MSAMIGEAECRSAGPSADRKRKWIIHLKRWSAKGLADLLCLVLSE